VIGTTVVLSGVSYRVVGVAPPGFKQPDAHRSGPWTPDFWHVFKAHNITDRGDHFAPMVARLRPGVSVAAANAGLARLFDELGRKYPTDDAHRTAVAVPLRQQLLGDVAPMLVTIYLAVVGVLLVACANVANLFLSRAAAREREVSVRFAVGASRGRILAQLFTEALLYVGAGGVLGFGLATIGIREFLAMKPPGIPFLDAVSVDWTVAAYTLAIVIATTLLTGLVPAVGLSRPDLSVALKAGGRGGDSSRGGRARNALAIAEIALALALVTASALSVRSFLALTGEPIGIDPTNVYVAAIRGFPVRYETDTNAVRNFQARVLEKLKGSPLIEDAAFDAMFPFGDRHSDTTLLFPGVHYAPGQEPATNISDATPDAFDVLREPLLRGRRFDERDGPGGAPVAIVNEAFVKRFFPDGNAIGKRIKPDQASVEKEPPYRTIVGIVGNAPEDFVTPDNPATWVPSAQEPDISSGILVRSRGSRADIAAVLKDAVTAADATMPAPKIESLGSKMSDSVARVRIGAALLALLAGVALFLAVAGVYAVISYGVERRTHEIGIRMALGARSGQVVAMILRGAGAMAAIGILAGLGLAAASSRMLQSQLVGITALDPWTYVCVVAILVSAVILAAAIPALRAARVDPNEALRYE
jgi:putative ABC transport system permease protein